jgi:hypothetical protein
VGRAARGVGAVGALMVHEIAAAVREWVERSCATQGVPVFVTDVVVVGRVGVLLGGRVPARAPAGARRDPSPTAPTRAQPDPV